MKDHKKVGGKLLQTNKRFSNLKEKQKLKINEWLYIEYMKYRKSTNKLPDKEQDRKIICSVGQLVADAEIWIPEKELIKYYIAHKNKFEKRFEKE